MLTISFTITVYNTLSLTSTLITYSVFVVVAVVVFGCLFLVVFWCIGKNVTLQMKLVSVRLVLELLWTVTWYTPQIDLDSLLNLADS